MNQKLKPKLKQIKPLFWITPAVVVLDIRITAYRLGTQGQRL